MPPHELPTQPPRAPACASRSPASIQLRDYQNDAVADLLGWLRHGDRNLGLVMPTGSGKTVTTVAFLRQARALRLFRAALVATPAVTIEDGFGDAAGDALHRVRGAATARNAAALMAYLSGTGAPIAPALGWLTTHQQLVTWGVGAPARWRWWGSSTSSW